MLEHQNECIEPTRVDLQQTRWEAQFSTETRTGWDEVTFERWKNPFEKILVVSFLSLCRPLWFVQLVKLELGVGSLQITREMKKTKATIEHQTLESKKTSSDCCVHNCSNTAFTSFWPYNILDIERDWALLSKLMHQTNWLDQSTILEFRYCTKLEQRNLMKPSHNVHQVEIVLYSTRWEKTRSWARSQSRKLKPSSTCTGKETLAE